MSNTKQNEWIETTANLALNEIRYIGISNLNDNDLESFYKKLSLKLKQLANGEKLDDLDEEEIQRVFNKLNEDGNDVEDISKYIFHNYEPQAYVGKQFVIVSPSEYGLNISSFKIDSNSEKHLTLDGVSTFINPTKNKVVYPFTYSSYIFYNNGKKVKNYLSENIHSNRTEYFINGKSPKNNDPEEEPLNSILKQINMKIEKEYPWIQELVKDFNEFRILIIDAETKDKVNFQI
jgi:hypothetical protein